MNDQCVAGFPFAVREILFTTASRTDLDELVTTYGVTLGSLTDQGGQHHY